MKHAIGIIILDFDQTITINHTSGCATPEQLTAEFIRSNIKEGFVEFVQSTQQHQIKLYIATYGDDRFATEPDHTAGHALVKYYMDEVLGSGQTLFRLPLRDSRNNIIKHRNIIARLSQDFKDYHLNIIAEREGINLSSKSSLKHMLIIDDEKDIVDYFKQAGCMVIARKLRTAAKTAAAPDLFLRLIHYLNS